MKNWLKIAKKFRIADNLPKKNLFRVKTHLNVFLNFRTSEIKNADKAFFCTFPRSWNSF